MEAKDTVLTGEEMSEEIQRKTKKWSVCNPAFIEDVAGIIAGRQAEISFRAGRKEVVNWIEDNCIGCLLEEVYPDEYFGVQTIKWQAQCKKWGIGEDGIEQDS